MHEIPDTINEFAIIGDFGFHRVEGPFRLDSAGTNRTVILPLADDVWGNIDARTASLLEDTEGERVALVADGEIVGGGVVTDVWAPDGEDELHLVVDQYARKDV